jgi:hypothetical protein
MHNDTLFIMESHINDDAALVELTTPTKKENS